MKRLFAVFVLSGISVQAQTITETFGSGANQFSIDFVQIGNPGNAADTTGSPNPVGSVGYIYNLGKYEISRDMITKANAVGSLGITLSDMSSYGGNGGNRPATGISWNEAARFVNWLNTSRGYQAAYLLDGSGNLQLWSSARSVANNLFRHKNAYYFLPSVDEWYKAAFYNPVTATYLSYPTSSNSAPGIIYSGTSGAVYNHGLGPAEVFSAGSLSPYGTMAQGGNAWEWEETAFDLNNDLSSENRGMRGGSWDYSSSYLLSSNRQSISPNADKSIQGSDDVGFRVAMVPEPSSLSLLLVGGAVLMAGRRRK